MTLSGDYVGPPLGNWRLDWRRWVNEGLIDEIITPVFFEANLDHDAIRKGFLTHVREGIGVPSHRQIKDFIRTSPHPEIKVIATAAPPYMFEKPPDGADGWRTDIWYSTYHLAWYQRWWKQWMTDVEDFGHIRFFQQNFDEFPTDSAGHAGGWGEWRYDPELRACPGVWSMLGDGSDAKPIAVKDTFHGNVGQAMKLTASRDHQSTLNAFHRSYPDRSNFTTGLDTAITNGLATFEFWIFRPDGESGLAAYLQGTETEGIRSLQPDGENAGDVAIRIAPGSGLVSYASTGNGGSIAWVQTKHSVPVARWHRLVIEVNLDKGTYGARDGNVLCSDIPMAKARPRFTHLPGVNVPFEVPAYKMFRQLLFVPEGQPGAVTYIDDVSLNWRPTLHYTRADGKVLFHDDFENQPVDATINGRRGVRGSWKVSSETSGNQAFCVTNDTSFGEGVNSIHATGGGTMTVRTNERLSYSPNSITTIDLDLFVRSDADFPYITPDLRATSSHRVILDLKRKITGEYAATVIAAEGTWWIWNETRFVNTNVRVAYDVWNHVQIAVDAPSGSYRVVAQPVGEVPTLVGAAKLGDTAVINEDMELSIETSDTEGQSSCFDNVMICAGTKH